MDPAFSLADELAGLDHPQEQFSGSLGDSLDAELEALHIHNQQGSTLDAELEALHLHEGGNLASELDPTSLHFGEGSLADELSSLDHAGSLHFAEGSLANDLSSPSQPSSSSPSRNPSQHSPPRRTASSESISLLAAAQERKIQDSIAATTRFLSRLSSIEGGDTARLEGLAGGYLKLIAESVSEREGQMRELRELDRRLSRLTEEQDRVRSSSFSPRSSILGDLGELAPLAEEGDDPLSPSTSTSFSHPGHRHSASLSSDGTITDIPSTPTTFTNSSSAALDPALFAPLHTSTASLLTSLTGLHEQTQITKSQTADASRKLKNLRGLIGTWKADQASVEDSEWWISERDKEEKGRGEGGRKAKEELEACRRRLEEAEEGWVRRLLTPVSIAS